MWLMNNDFINNIEQGLYASQRCTHYYNYVMPLVNQDRLTPL